MHWNHYKPEIIERASEAPGGITIAEMLFKLLDPRPESQYLDLCPGSGVITSIAARDLGLDITAVVGNPDAEREVESSAADFGVSDHVHVIPGSARALPLPTETFQGIYCIGRPFFPYPNPVCVRELYRVLEPGGKIGLAGFVSLTNEVPEHMREALASYSGARICTPAFSALQFTREGFHILNAEYIKEAWDSLTEWMKESYHHDSHQALKRAIAEDAGRWLSLGIVVLRKPPRPSWAL